MCGRFNVYAVPELTDAVGFGDAHAKLRPPLRSRLFSTLLLTFSFNTARRKSVDEGGMKSGTFFSWLIPRLPLCLSQWSGVIDADRGVKLLPGPHGCVVLWAQEANQPSSSKTGPMNTNGF